MMEWTKEPTETGWYWLWEEVSGVSGIVWVATRERVWRLHRKVSDPVGKYKGCWWYGPLTPPTPPGG
jgi:hypothetical protein